MNSTALTSPNAPETRVSGRSSPSRRSTSSASIPFHCGRLQSASTRSGRCARSCRSNSASSCTTTTEAEKPPRRSARATSSASSSLSSMCSTRSWPGCGARSSVSVMRHTCQLLRSLHDGRLIDDQPVQSDRLDRLPELSEVDWFLDIAVSPQVVTGHQIPLFFRRSHDDDWDGLGPRVTLDLFEHFHPVDLGQFQIQQHQLGRMIKRSVGERPATEDKVQSLLAIPCDEDVVRQLFQPQRMQGKVHIFLTVFHQNYVQCI